jgi:protein-tyrosine phosphatase
MADAWRPNEPPALSGAEARAQFIDHVSLILDDGPSRYGGPATEVVVAQSQCQVTRPGVVENAAIAQFAQPMILLVCTGNTCRSPMAQALLEHRLQPWVDEQHRRRGASSPSGASVRWLPPRVISAGLAAGQGMPASAEAIDTMERWGLDLSHHQSRPVSDAMIRNADLILTMTRSHREGLINRWPNAAARTHVLRLDGGDISDPIGCPASIYQACAEQIDRELAGWVDRLGTELWAEILEPSSQSA